MNRLKRRFLLRLGMWADLLAGLVGLILVSGLARTAFSDGGTLVVQHPLREATELLLLLSAWHLSFVGAGYYRSFRVADRLELLLSLLRGVLSATTCTCVWFLAHARQYVWSAEVGNKVLLWSACCGLFLLTSRIVLRASLKWIRGRGRNMRQLLVIGTNLRALRAADALTSGPGLGYTLVGFIDDCWYAGSAEPRHKEKLLGGLEMFPNLLRSSTIDEVLIALPVASTYSAIRNICALCKQHGVLVRYEASLIDEVGSANYDTGRSLQLITLNDSTWNEWSLVTKRMLDVLLSSIALLLTLPIMVCIGIAIKLDSPGSIFFSQERLGLNKRRFIIFKFRTMVVDAEARMRDVEHLNQSEGPTFKLRNDPRVTRLGAFLRRTSLDELPQFVNVFLGHMSLVGPRPLPLRDYCGFSEDWYRRRLSVKPGMTCLWQVMGRSSISFTRWMELDLNYIDEWSIWLDLKILFQTISVVLKGSGAF